MLKVRIVALTKKWSVLVIGGWIADETAVDLVTIKRFAETKPTKASRRHELNLNSSKIDRDAPKLISKTLVKLSLRERGSTRADARVWSTEKVRNCWVAKKIKRIVVKNRGIGYGDWFIEDSKPKPDQGERKAIKNNWRT